MDQETKQEFEGLTQKIDQLANAVKVGFDAVDQRFEEMATKDDLTRVESRLDSIDSNIAEIQSDLENIRQDLEHLEKRTRNDDDAVVKDIFALRRRVDAMETQLKQIKLNQS